MTTEKVWFSQAIEGLFIRGVGDAMTPQLRAELLALGIDLHKLLPGYANEPVIRAIRLTARTLNPQLGEAGGLYALGVTFMNGYVATLIGSAMVQVMKVIGPRRSLQRMERNFRSGNNFIETKFSAVGPTSAEVWFNDVNGVPDFFAGILTQGGVLAGAKDQRLKYSQPTPPACTFHIEWSE